MTFLDNLFKVFPELKGLEVGLSCLSLDCELAADTMTRRTCVENLLQDNTFPTLVCHTSPSEAPAHPMDMPLCSAYSIEIRLTKCHTELALSRRPDQVSTTRLQPQRYSHREWLDRPAAAVPCLRAFRLRKGAVKGGIVGGSRSSLSCTPASVRAPRGPQAAVAYPAKHHRSASGTGEVLFVADLLHSVGSQHA